MDAVTVLVQAGKKEDLAAQDSTGCTPGQLASDKGHHHVALFLVSLLVALSLLAQATSRPLVRLCLLIMPAEKGHALLLNVATATVIW